MDWRRARYILGIGVVLAALLVAVALRPPPRGPQGLEGQVIPEFALPLITPLGVSTTAQDSPIQHRGKPFLLHFWAPSCPPCRQELPLWVQIAKSDRRVTVLTVASDDEDDIAAYLKAHAPELPAGHGTSSRLYRALGVWGLPHTFAISRTGVVVRDLVGAQTAESLEEAIVAAVAAP